jgi:hypothetical protein
MSHAGVKSNSISWPDFLDSDHSRCGDCSGNKRQNMCACFYKEPLLVGTQTLSQVVGLLQREPRGKERLIIIDQTKWKASGIHVIWKERHFVNSIKVRWYCPCRGGGWEDIDGLFQHREVGKEEGLRREVEVLLTSSWEDIFFLKACLFE